MTSLCLSSFLSLLFGSCLFATLIKWLKNYPIAQLRPGLASNVNFAHRTVDNGQWTGPRHITDMDSSDTGRRILSQIRAYLACFHHQYGRYGDGFRDGQKRQTGVGMHNSQLATTDQLEIFWKYQIWKGVDEILFWAHVEDWLIKHWSSLLAVLGIHSLWLHLPLCTLGRN